MSWRPVLPPRTARNLAWPASDNSDARTSTLSAGRDIGLSTTPCQCASCPPPDGPIASQHPRFSMRPLIARPGRNAAREAKRIKDVRKVRNAIQWHDAQRKKRQALVHERWEAKQAIIQRVKWENINVRDHRRTALANVREDWRLGPLRPNRAPSTAPEKYGAMASERMQKPEIPMRSVKNRNAFRERKGLAPEYPLIVDDKCYFPIVKGDRVAIISGIDKGKIGFVNEVITRSHEVIVKGLNMVRLHHLPRRPMHD